MANIEDDMLLGGIVVVFGAAVEGPKSSSRSSVSEVVTLDGALSSKSISDNSFLVEVAASSCGIGLAAAT